MKLFSLEHPSWLSQVIAKVESMPPRHLLFLLFLGNFVLRLLLTLPARPYSPPHDGCHYMLLGRALARKEGYVNHVLYAPRFVGQGRFCDTLPYPDFQRPPLYPFLLSLSYRIWGESYFAARLVNVILGALIPILTYLLALRLVSVPPLEGSAHRIALLSAILVTGSGVLAEYTSETMLEFCYIVCVSLFLIVFFAGTRNRRWEWILLSGPLWGIAWYARHEAIYVLFVPVLLELLLFFGFFRGILLFGGTLAGAILLITPWHIRAWLLTGNPWHSDLKHHLLAAYADFHEYFCEWTPLPHCSLLDFFISQPGSVFRRYLTLFYELVVQIPLSVIDGVWFTFLAGLGSAFLWREKRHIAALGIWILANLAFFSFTFSLARFLYVLIPLFAILSAIGFEVLRPHLAPQSSRSALAWTIGLTLLGTLFFHLAQSGTARERIGMGVLLGLFLVLFFFVGVYLYRKDYLRLSPRFLVLFSLLNLLLGFIGGSVAGIREHRKERYPPTWIQTLQALPPPHSTIMVYRKPYFYGWILDRDVVQMPLERKKRRGESDEAYAEYRRQYTAYLADLLERFRVRWIVIKGRQSQKGSEAMPAVIYTHGWAPGEEPFPFLHYHGSQRYGTDVYDLYEVKRERATPSSP